MRPYDRINPPHCSVFVPWNEKDPETERNKEMLRRNLSETLPMATELKSKTIYYHNSITSDRSLKHTLMKTLTDIRLKLMANAKPPEPIQDNKLAEQAREKGINVDSIATVQSPGANTE